MLVLQPQFLDTDPDRHSVSKTVVGLFYYLFIF